MDGSIGDAGTDAGGASVDGGGGGGVRGSICRARKEEALTSSRATIRMRVNVMVGAD